MRQALSDAMLWICQGQSGRTVMSFYKSSMRQRATRAGRPQQVALRAKGRAPAGLARVVANPQRANVETLLQLQHLYGNRSVTHLVGNLAGRGGVIQRAGGLPTGQELVTWAGGHGAGKKLFGKSAFKKIMNALDAFRNDIGDDDAEAKLD